MSVRPDPTSVMVRSAVLTSIAALPVSALAGGLWRGAPGALSAVGGGLVVMVFFAFGVSAVNLITTALPGLAVVGAFAVYATQLMVLLLVIVVARDYVAIDRPAFALGAVAGTMVWQVAHTRAYARARLPLYAAAYTPTAPKEEP